MNQPEIIDVTYQSYRNEVMEKSMTKLVVVDFWAPWCQPCKVLTPLLEKLARDMDFVLAKVDTEKNPQLAAAFQIQSIPHVKIYQNGREVSQFDGVVPEAALRDHLKQFLMSPEDLELEQVDGLIQEGRLDSALKFLEHFCQDHPENYTALLKLGKVQMRLRRWAEAHLTLKKIDSKQKEYKDAQASLGFIELGEFADKDPDHDDEKELQRTVQLAFEDNMEESLESMLQLFQKSINYKDKVRETMIIVFKALGPANPLTLKYRSKLSALLFS